MLSARIAGKDISESEGCPNRALLKDLGRASLFDRHWEVFVALRKR